MKEEQTHIELFDLYLRNELPDTDKADFEKKLVADPEFKQQFTQYILIVEGIKLKEREELKAYMKKQAKMEYWGQNFWGKNWTYASAALLFVFASLYIVTKQFNNSSSKQENDLAIEQQKEKVELKTENTSPKSEQNPVKENVITEEKTLDNIVINDEQIPNVAESEMSPRYDLETDDADKTDMAVNIEEEKKIAEKVISINDVKEISIEFNNNTWNTKTTSTTLPSNFPTSNNAGSVFKKNKVSTDKNKDKKPEAEEKKAVETVDTTKKLVNTNAQGNKLLLQFWSSPLNYKGYQYNNNVLKLYGIIENNPKLHQYNNILYLVNDGKVYKITPCNETCNYIEEADINIKNTILNQP